MGTEAAQDDPFIFTLALKPVNAAIKEARDLIAFAWKHWELGDDYAARLVASELVTNAVRASEEDQSVVVRCYLHHPGLAVLEVWDQSAEPVVMKSTSLTDTGGRGIYIVDQLVRSWQVHPITEGGKLVRVELPADLDPDGW